jgi:PAS domain S-box-containing protein
MRQDTDAGGEGLYRFLVESSPDAILISRHSRVTFVNPRGERLLGASASRSLVGRSTVELFQPHARARMLEYMTRWLDGEATPAVREQVVRLDGTLAEVDVTGSRLDAGSGAVQIVIREGTDAVPVASASQRENLERLTLAFAGAREGVYDWNVETGAVVYSARWKEMLGYSDDEIEPHVSAWERLLHPDDRHHAQLVNRVGVPEGQTYEVEFRLRHRSGQYLHILSRGFPIRRRPDGHVVRVVGTHLDITDRKRAEAALRESEERLTLAFAGAQEGVWDWNLETGAVVYSSRWKEMLGYAEDDIEPHVSAWERLLHPDDRERAREVNDGVARGDRTYEGEFRLRHKAGHYLQVLSRGFPVRRGPGGPIVRIVGTHFDLTERNRVAAEHARAELLTRMVFAQEDERRRIAREMHDQFGEQLTELGLRIRTLKGACAERPDLRLAVEALEGVANRLDRDVDHLVWELRPTALDDLGLRAALANYVQSWSARVNIAAELHTSGLIDERLSSEAETTFYRIAQEALTNVAKHANARKVDVILERRSDHALLIIEDDGVGFDPADKGAAGGGFGLLGMHERAALVGAALQIESAAGAGTTILVRLATTAERSTPEHG